MLRVRVVRSFVHDGQRLRPGQEVALGDALARAPLTDGTVVAATGLPARKRYENRMMTADDYQTRGARCSR
jgi:hypothetical protein